MVVKQYALFKKKQTLGAYLGRVFKKENDTLHSVWYVARVRATGDKLQPWFEHHDVYGVHTLSTHMRVVCVLRALRLQDHVETRAKQQNQRNLDPIEMGLSSSHLDHDISLCIERLKTHCPQKIKTTGCWCETKGRKRPLVLPCECTRNIESC